MNYKEILKIILSVGSTILIMFICVIYGASMTHTKIVNECNDFIEEKYGYLEPEHKPMFNFSISIQQELELELKTDS